MTELTHAALVAGIERAQAEAGGLMSFFVVKPHEGADLFAEALNGNPEAGRLVRVVVETIRKIETAPKRKPLLCATCNRALRLISHSFVVAMPATDAATQTICLGVCVKCARSSDQVQQKALIAFRKIWPALRSIDITHSTAGHA